MLPTPLITEFCALFFQCTGMFIEGFFLLILFRFKDLRKRASLRLIQYLVATDLLCAIFYIPKYMNIVFVSATPYILYIMYGWTERSMNFDPWTILLLSIVANFDLKVNIILTISIALDRVIALYFPTYYRDFNVKRFCHYCLATALIAATVDNYAVFHFTKVERHPGCQASGCFINPQFLTIYGFVNLGLGILKIVLTAAVLLKLHVLGVSIPYTLGNTEKQRFKQANRLSVGVLAVSLSFTTFPSLVYSLATMLKWSIFSNVGPISFLGLIMSGNGTPIVYLLFHSEIRRSARQMMSASSTNVVSISQPES